MKSCDYKCCVCVCVIEVETVKDIEKQYVEKQLKKNNISYIDNSISLCNIIGIKMCDLPWT